MENKLKYKRVLLKLSGEAFLGTRDFGIDPHFVDGISKELSEIINIGVELVIVIGGGNFFRGKAAEKNGLDRTSADYIGMLATVMNSIALKDSFDKMGIPVRVMSAIEMPKVCESYIRDKAVYQLKKGRTIIAAAGSGNPYFSTDTAAALRALELKCDVVLKATKVDGIYTHDPKLVKEAQKYPQISHKQAITDELKVMDATALSLCMENKMPIIVFNLLEKGNIKKVVLGEEIGTIVS